MADVARHAPYASPAHAAPPDDPACQVAARGFGVSAVACEILPPMPTHKQGALPSIELDFGVVLADLTDPGIVLRSRAQPATTAVDGLGALTQEDADSPLVYQWHEDDPTEPGVYVIELDAEEGTWPQGSHFFVRVIEQAG